MGPTKTVNKIVGNCTNTTLSLENVCKRQVSTGSDLCEFGNVIEWCFAYKNGIRHPDGDHHCGHMAVIDGFHVDCFETGDVQCIRAPVKDDCTMCGPTELHNVTKNGKEHAYVKGPANWDTSGCTKLPVTCNPDFCEVFDDGAGCNYGDTVVRAGCMAPDEWTEDKTPVCGQSKLGSTAKPAPLKTVTVL